CCGMLGGFLFLPQLVGEWKYLWLLPICALAWVGATRARSWSDAVAASRSGRGVLKMFGASVGILMLGYCTFLLALSTVEDLHGVTWRDRDPRTDPWFYYVGFVAPTALTLLSLASFHGLACAAHVRRDQYTASVRAAAFGGFVSLTYLMFM